MNLTEKHNRFYNKLNMIFLIVLLVCLVTPMFLSKVNTINKDVGSSGFFLIMIILSLSFGLPAMMLGYLRTVKFEQSDCVSVKDLKGSFGLSLLFVLCFGILYLLVEHGVSYLFSFYITGGNIGDLLYLVYAYHLVLIYLFTITRK